MYACSAAHSSVSLLSSWSSGMYLCCEEVSCLSSSDISITYLQPPTEHVGRVAQHVAPLCLEVVSNFV